MIYMIHDITPSKRTLLKYHGHSINKYYMDISLIVGENIVF